MQAGTAFWHLVNFVLPALITSGAAACLGRWLQRRQPRRVGLLRSWAVVGGPALAADSAALFITGQDGTIAGYAAMLIACVLALAWLDRRGAG